MSLPILEQFEAQRTASRQRMETEKLMRANGHSQSEIDATVAAGPQAQATAGAGTAKERNNPRNYTPPQTLLGGSSQGSHVTAKGRKETEEALNEAGANSLEGKLTRATEGAREDSEAAGEKLSEVAKAKVNLPNPLSWTEAIAKVFSKLAEGSFWVRVLKFVLGAGMLVIAVFFFARAAGLGVPNPVTAATQEASQAVTGASTAQRQRTTGVSDQTRKRVQAAAGADAERDHTPRSRSGKPLAGAALANPARQRARVRERDAALPSTRELAKGAKRR